MVEPEKPFACNLPDCGMTFTNEDHLNVHTKKHDMVLQLGLEQKSAFVADQTPTPTRFIRNCEEVGLFQDLQNVSANPFDEGFKRAMEAKQGLLTLEAAMTSSDDVLHTPLVFPLGDGDSTLFTNNQRNITISRSSSDESGTIKEFETRTISKLTNEVTTISRIINNQSDDITIKHTDIHKDIETVSYKNNVIKIASNVIRKDLDTIKVPVTKIDDKVANAENKNLQVEKVPIMSQKSIDFVVDSLTSELDKNNQTVEVNNDLQKQNTVILNYGTCPQIKVTNSIKNKSVRRQIQPRILRKPVKVEENCKIEVLVTLPNGKRVKMRPVDDNEEKNVTDTKEILRNRIAKKVAQKVPMSIEADPLMIIKPVAATVPNTVTITSGRLIPVTIVNQEGTPLSNTDLSNVPITKISHVDETLKTGLDLKPTILTVPKNIISKEIKPTNDTNKKISTFNKKPEQKERKVNINTQERDKESNEPPNEKLYFPQDNNLADKADTSDVEMIENRNNQEDNVVEVAERREVGKRRRFELESRCAASKRYRERLKESMKQQSEENRQLREANRKLVAEKAYLKLIIKQHLKECANSTDLYNRLSALRHCDF